LTQPDAPFEEPWQAQLFALTLAMNEAGHFSWSEWAAVFGPRVQKASAERYWSIWAEALVVLLEKRGVTTREGVEALREKWQIAAEHTPHGEPIVLSTATYVYLTPD